VPSKLRKKGRQYCLQHLSQKGTEILQCSKTCVMYRKHAFSAQNLRKNGNSNLNFDDDTMVPNKPKYSFIT
jgi:hypothetical protein